MIIMDFIGSRVFTRNDIQKVVNNHQCQLFFILSVRFFL